MCAIARYRDHSVLIVALTVLACAASAWGQAGVCVSTSTNTCLNQPHAGDTTLTGTIAAPLVDGKPADLSKATVTFTVSISNQAQKATCSLAAGGAFTCTGLYSLNPYNTVSIAVAINGGASDNTISAVKVAPAQVSETKSGLFTLGLVGVNATSSSSSGPSQQYFVDFNVTAPLRWLGKGCRDADITGTDPTQRRCWVWFNPRIASLPAAANGNLTSLSSLSAGASSQTVGQITQSFEFQAGGEYYLLTPSGDNFWGIGNSWAKSGLSLIFGGGTVTPFNSLGQAAEFGLNSNLGQQFNQTPRLAQEFPQLSTALCNYGFTGNSFQTCPTTPPATTPTTVAFVFPNRSRFYRDFFFGLRLRFFYYQGKCHGKEAIDSCVLADTFPGTIDFRAGEDETVTGGHLAPWVMTVNGTFAVPGTGGVVRVFGTTYMRINRANVDTNPLILVPSTNFTSLDMPAVVVQPVPRTDQDYYRLGIGVDIIPLINKWVKGSSSPNNKNSTNGSD